MSDAYEVPIRDESIRLGQFLKLANLIESGAEAKEVIASFALIQAKSKEEAVEQAARFLRICGEGEADVYQVYDMHDFGPATSPELREQEERSRAAMEARRRP